MSKNKDYTTCNLLDYAYFKEYQKYLLLWVNIEHYNIETDARNFYDQTINDSVKQYDEVRKVSKGQGDDYTTGCLLDFAYLEKNYRLTAADLSKQKPLDADPRAIQQIIFTGKIKSTVANTRVIIYYILEHQKKQAYKSLKEQRKFCNQYKWLITVK